MGNLAVSEKKQLNMRIFHLCVVALFTLGFGHLPTFSTVTPYGMKALGCFLGILYGWVFVDMLWTSLMVFVLVPFTGLITADGLITAGFGNVVVMQVCFILMLFSVVSNTEIPSKITNKLLGMKICTGKPWVFVGVLLFATWVVSWIAGGVIGLLVLFPIVISLCEDYNIERYGKSSTTLFMGVLLADCLGQMCMPVKGMPLILMAMYKAIDPNAVFPIATYMVFSIILTLSLLLFSLLVFKYLLRVKLDSLANLDPEIFKNERNKFTKKEFIILLTVSIVLLLMILQGTFPNETIKNFLGLFGSISFCFIGMMVLLWIKIDGEPITNMPQMAKGMSWDTLLTVASMQPVLAFISADEAGIKAMLSDVCGPIIANLSPLMFVLFVIVICGLLTNILNNAACCLMFFPIVMIYAPQLGLSAIGMVFSLIIISHVAFATPAASFYSLIAFGYTHWIKASSFMKYSFILLLPLLICGVIMSYLLLLILF